MTTLDRLAATLDRITRRETATGHATYRPQDVRQDLADLHAYTTALRAVLETADFYERLGVQYRELQREMEGPGRRAARSAADICEWAAGDIRHDIETKLEERP